MSETGGGRCKIENALNIFYSGRKEQSIKLWSIINCLNLCCLGLPPCKLPGIKARFNNLKTRWLDRDPPNLKPVFLNSPRSSSSSQPGQYSNYYPLNFYLSIRNAFIDEKRLNKIVTYNLIIIIPYSKKWQ